MLITGSPFAAPGTEINIQSHLQAKKKGEILGKRQWSRVESRGEEKKMEDSVTIKSAG